MHTLLQLSPLGFLDVGPWMIGLVLPIAGLIFVGVVVVSAMYFKHQQKLAWHQTARVALDKGVPLPPMTFDRTDDVKPLPATGDVDPVVAQRIRREQAQRNDVRNGLVLTACGASLFLLLRAVAGDHVMWVGAIPGLMGVALVVHGMLDRVFTPKKD